MKRFSRFIGELYQKHFAQKLFNKILMIYSFIIMITLLALSFFIYHYFTQYMINKESIRIKEASDNVSAYIDRRVDILWFILENMYSNDAFMQNIEVLLQKGYPDYLSYRLDRYFNTNTPIDSNLKSLSPYFNGGFDIESMLFASTEGKLYRVTDQLSLEIISPDEELKYEVIKNRGLVTPIRIFPVVPENVAKQQLYALTAELNSPNTLAPIGQLVIMFKENGIKKQFPQTPSDLKGEVLVLTHEGDVIYDSSSKWYGGKYPIEQLMENQTSKPITDSNSKLNYTLSAANKAGVIVVGLMSDEELKLVTMTLKRWIAFITLICIFGALILTYMLILRFSKRTKVIVRAMENLVVGHRNVRVPMSEKDELYQISYHFNKMCDRVEDYIEKVYVSEIKQKNAEITAMQMQINPHFLYNTLEAIRMNAVAHGASEAGHMIFLLAALFRNTMKSAMIVDVSEEIQRCRLYLELFQIRYSNRLQITIHISEEMMNSKILKLTVQPIVENYVLHGFQADRKDNILQIEGIVKEGIMHIRVSDNGKGITFPDLMKIRQSLNDRFESKTSGESIGLSNVNLRLSMMYGSEYGLEIQSTYGIGTEVMLKIPASDKE